MSASKGPKAEVSRRALLRGAVAATLAALPAGAGVAANADRDRQSGVQSRSATSERAPKRSLPIWLGHL